MILLASDHAGYNLKSFLVHQLSADHPVIDLGTNSEIAVDYPDLARLLSLYMKQNKGIKDNLQNHTSDNSSPSDSDTIGILICGSGIGMSITANRFPWIRAALCSSVEHAVLARQHNNANVLVMGEKFTDKILALEITKAFLVTKDSDEERHRRRIKKITSCYTT